MDSFDQLLKLVNEAHEAYKAYLEKSREPSITDVFVNYEKCNRICTNIEERLNKINRDEGRGYAQDLCAYYMATDWLNRYRYSTLADLTVVVAEKIMERSKKTELNQQDTLKQTIKEAIREARQEELKTKSKRRKRKLVNHKS